MRWVRRTWGSSPGPELEAGTEGGAAVRRRAVLPGCGCRSSQLFLRSFLVDGLCRLQAGFLWV